MGKKVVFAGIDPAPAGSGLSLLILGTSEVKSQTYETDPAFGDFANWYLRSVYITKRLMYSLYSIADVKQRIIVLEYPPPQGYFAPGLYGLAYMLLEKIKDSIVILAHPVLTQSLLGRRAGKKGTGGMLKQIMCINGLTVNHKQTEHEADATILLLWAINNMAGRILLPEEGEYKCSPDRWIWKVKRVDLSNCMTDRNVKLYKYLGKEG